MDGHVRFMWTIGLTWFPAMLASQALATRVHELTRGNPHHPKSVDRDHLIQTYIERVESGGMVLVDSDIYPVDPLNTQLADIVLPAATWGEDDLTRCNSERRLRLYSGFYDPPAEAKPDWWAIAKFAQKMGFQGYDWQSSNDIFEEASRFSRTGVLSYHPLVVQARREGKTGHEKLREYGTTGIQTPIRVRDGELVGTERLHDPANDWGETEDVTFDRKWLYAFDTHSGKALLLKTPWVNGGWSDFYEAIKPRPEKGEIWITNGRVNEAWQSGFDDRRKPYLAKRWPWPFIFVHPRRRHTQRNRERRSGPELQRRGVRPNRGADRRARGRSELHQAQGAWAHRGDHRAVRGGGDRQRRDASGRRHGELQLSGLHGQLGLSCGARPGHRQLPLQARPRRAHQGRRIGLQAQLH